MTTWIDGLSAIWDWTPTEFACPACGAHVKEDQQNAHVQWHYLERDEI